MRHEPRCVGNPGSEIVRKQQASKKTRDMRENCHMDKLPRYGEILMDKKSMLRRSHRTGYGRRPRQTMSNKKFDDNNLGVLCVGAYPMVDEAKLAYCVNNEARLRQKAYPVIILKDNIPKILG